MLDDQTLMTRLRTFCATLPGSEEYVMVHHPAFRVKKKPYVIVGMSEAREGSPTLSVKVSKELQPVILENDRRFFKTPYIGQHGWITLRLEEPHTWEEVERLITQSWRGVAPAKLAAGLPGG